MSINAIPTDNQIVDKSGRLMSSWQAFLESINLWLGPVGNSGTTANRPKASSRHPLYVGQGYFDVTLGFPVYVKSLNPTVWVDGSGTTR
jgi:hypothetical protein